MANAHVACSRFLVAASTLGGRHPNDPGPVGIAQSTAEVAAARTDTRLRAEEDRKAKTLSKAVKDYYRMHPR